MPASATGCRARKYSSAGIAIGPTNRTSDAGGSNRNVTILPSSSSGERSERATSVSPIPRHGVRACERDQSIREAGEVGVVGDVDDVARDERVDIAVAVAELVHDLARVLADQWRRTVH